MLKDKFTKIKIKNKKQLISLNNNSYNIGDEIDILTSELPKGSHININVICSNCKSEKTIQFNTYCKITNNLNDDYYCNNKDCINKKRKISLNQKYGVDNVFQLDKIKNKIKKTNIEKYGVENPQQNKDIKQKTIKTTLLKYGFENVFQNEEIKEKSKKTMLRKYGVEYPQQSSVIRSKYPTLHKPSKLENDLLLFIKENYNSTILTNKNNIIPGYEIDVYLPDLKLAFEFNGLYWHSEIYKDYKYHYNKSELCSEKGIQLIHIWEDDWEYKKTIVKSMILNKLNKTKNRIFARKCKIKEISDNKLIRNFLNENHIQGFVGSSVKIGLFYESKLVSLMTFGKKRKHLNSSSSNNQYEMLRFCNKLNTNVIGGASKLFKYFIRNYNPTEVVSYADRSYSNGNLYKQLGFTLTHISRPNYYYIISRKRKYRFGFRKDTLVKQGFDPNKSEKEIMLERKIYRIYNSGNYVFKYN
ncbi:MAG: DUF7487 domain-containing protein [bacterium]